MCALEVRVGFPNYLSRENKKTCMFYVRHDSREVKHDVYGKQYAAACHESVKIYVFQRVLLFWEVLQYI